jgi:hypothetical protein
MKKALERLRERTPRERRALARAAFLIWTIQIGLALLPFRHVLRAVGRLAKPAGSGPGSGAGSSQFDKDLAVWSVEAASRRLLSRNPCLPKALAVLTLFRRAGIDAELRIGVAREGDDPMRAHAWVESEGEVVIGGDVPIEEYTPLPALGRIASGRGRSR